MSLDPEKIREAHKEIVESYNKKSKIPDIFDLREYNSKLDSGKKFIQIADRRQVDTLCLTNPGMDCRVYWQDMGFNVAVGEFNRLNKIINNASVKKLNLNKPTIDEIYKMIITVVAENNSDLLIFPVEIFRDFEIFLSNKIVYNPDSLLVNGNEIEIIVLNDFEDIVVLDSKSISWVYKPDINKERIVVDIPDLSKADITAKTVVNVEIIDPNAIKIIEITK